MKIKIDFTDVVINNDFYKLRLIDNSDLFDCFEYASNEEIAKYCGWDRHETLEYTKKFLDTAIESKDCLAICDTYLNKMIGTVSLCEPYKHFQEFDNFYFMELGYCLNHDYHNLGVMTSTIERFINYIFDNYNLDFVVARHLNGNIASERVLLKNKFIRYKTDDECSYYYLKNYNRNNKLEICCGSYKDAYYASIGGANRIELNSSLYLGGITPCCGTVKMIKKNLALEVNAMVRPRGAGFSYDELDYEEIFYQAKELLEAGADGIVFGFLNDDFEIAYDKTVEMISLIHSYNKKAIFHRAIDVVRNYNKSILLLKDLGIDRILTSGQFANAVDGVDNLKKAYELVGDTVEIVVGSGVNARNISTIREKTGINAFHTSAKKYSSDLTTTSKYNEVNYRYNNSDTYEQCDVNKVTELVEVINNLV